MSESRALDSLRTHLKPPIPPSAFALLSNSAENGVDVNADRREKKSIKSEEFCAKAATEDLIVMKISEDKGDKKEILAAPAAADLGTAVASQGELPINFEGDDVANSNMNLLALNSEFKCTSMSQRRPKIVSSKVLVGDPKASHNDLHNLNETKELVPVVENASPDLGGKFCITNYVLAR